jgi:hypothetical protein
MLDKRILLIVTNENCIRTDQEGTRQATGNREAKNSGSHKRHIQWYVTQVLKFSIVLKCIKHRFSDWQQIQNEAMALLEKLNDSLFLDPRWLDNCVIKPIGNNAIPLGSWKIYLRKKNSGRNTLLTLKLHCNSWSCSDLFAYLRSEPLRTNMKSKVHLSIFLVCCVESAVTFD